MTLQNKKKNLFVRLGLIEPLSKDDTFIASPTPNSHPQSTPKKDPIANTGPIKTASSHDSPPPNSQTTDIHCEMGLPAQGPVFRFFEKLGLIERAVQSPSDPIVTEPSKRKQPSLKSVDPRQSNLLRLDNISIVVEDLDGTILFFKELGLELIGRTSVEGPWVDRIIGLEGVQSDIALMETPDGHNRLELTRFRHPKAIAPSSAVPPVNTLGIGRLMFAVADIDTTVSRLEKLGAVLIGKIVSYEDVYRLCYLRGPEGIVIALAEQVGGFELE